MRLNPWFSRLVWVRVSLGLELNLFTLLLINELGLRAVEGLPKQVYLVG